MSPLNAHKPATILRTPAEKSGEASNALPDWHGSCTKCYELASARVRDSQSIPKSVDRVSIRRLSTRE